MSRNLIFCSFCPFCGSKMAPKIWTSEEYAGEMGDDLDGSSGLMFAVVCDASKPGGPGGCGASGGFFETEQLAADTWNKRAP